MPYDMNPEPGRPDRDWILIDKVAVKLQEALQRPITHDEYWRLVDALDQGFGW
ncbi:MAG: hypothetical protein ACU0BB_07905 [Paracoccaceae bacterium]